jgi:hypothetical protein
VPHPFTKQEFTDVVYTLLVLHRINKKQNMEEFRLIPCFDSETESYQEVEQYTIYLGVVLDKKLCWNPQIQRVKDRATATATSWTKMGPKAINDEMDICHCRTTNGDLRIICVVAEN